MTHATHAQKARVPTPAAPAALPAQGPGVHELKPSPAKPVPAAKPAAHPGPAELAKTDKAKTDAKQHQKQEAKHEKKQRKKLHHNSLQEYLEKAGYERSADSLRSIIKWSIVATLGLATAILLVMGIVGTGWLTVLSGVGALWTVGFAMSWLIVWAIVYFFLDYRIYQRTKELEAVLPDFLQLASSNIAAGMPIDRALWYAIRPNFGVLAKEMEDVAKATMAGEDLDVSLKRMTQRYDSVVLKRSINILIEGLNAGGEMADLLNKIALNIDEMRIMKKEMAASVTSYAIFITFASVAIAPILFALATELLVIIIKISGSLDTGATSSMLTMAAPSLDAVSNFKIFSVLMLIVLTTFSAAIVSVIKRGSVFEGVKTMPVFAIIALIIYFLALRMLHGLFGSII